MDPDQMAQKPPGLDLLTVLSKKDKPGLAGQGLN